MARCSHLVIFFLREKFCVSHASASCLWDVYSLKPPIRPCGKNYISGHIWHKSFIKTVKCSFFNQIIVNQSFYGTLLTFSYFLLQGKVVCFGTRWQVTCEILIFKCLTVFRPCRKKYTVLCKSNANNNRWILRFVLAIYRRYISKTSHGLPNFKMINHRDIGTIFAIYCWDIVLARLRCNDISQSKMMYHHDILLQRSSL